MEEYSGPEIFIEDFDCCLEIDGETTSVKRERLAKLIRLPKGFDEKSALPDIFENGKDGRFC
jgi:hypothetical protein